MRKTTALLAALAIVASLTACSASNTVADCSPTLQSGAASQAITAKGAIDTAPKITLPKPLYTNTTQRSTLIAGHGAAIGSGQPVIVEVTIINARNDVVLQKTSYTSNGGSLITSGESTFPAVSEGLVCAQVGSRIAVIASPKDGHNGTADSANGIKKNDSFVYVIDVKAAFLAKANGALQSPKVGVPSVVTAANGATGITLPTTPAPNALQTTVLRQGSGKALTDGHYAVVQYTGVGWTDVPTVFDSTWKAGQASVLQLGATSVSPGLSQALTGQKVGSQVLVVIPAKQAAAADGSGTAPAGETVVYVVDILGIAA